MTQPINSASVDEPCKTCGGDNILNGKDADGVWDIAPCPDCWGCTQLTPLQSSKPAGQ